MMILLLALLTAAIASFVAGFFGGGSSLVAIPVLTHLLPLQHIPPDQTMHVALGTTLAFGIFSMLFAAYFQHKKGAIDWSLFKRLFMPTVLGIILGSLLASLISGPMLHIIFGSFLLLLALWTLYKRDQSPTKPWSIEDWTFQLGAFCIAITVGFIGSGILTIPFLRKHGIGLLQSIALTIALGIITASFGTLSYIVAGWHEPGLPSSCLGYMDWQLLIPFALGSTVFSGYGVAMSHKVSSKTLHYLFCLFLVVIGLKMLLG